MTRISNNNAITPLRTLPKRALPPLRNTVKIDSFSFGKETLRPIIVEQFKKQGKEIGEIHLDPPAKIRLMGMSPSLKERVEGGEKIDQILSGDPLELSLFLTEDGNLYILGDKQNISLMKELIKEKISEPSGYKASLWFNEPSYPKSLWYFNKISIDKELTDSEESWIIGFLAEQYSNKTGILYETWPHTSQSPASFLRLTKLEDNKYRIDLHVPISEGASKFKDVSFVLKRIEPPSSSPKGGVLMENIWINAWVPLQMIKNPRVQADEVLKIKGYTIKIIDPDPQNFTFEINNLPIDKCLRNPDNRQMPEEYETSTYTLTARVVEKGVKFFFPGKSQVVEVHTDGSSSIEDDVYFAPISGSQFEWIELDAENPKEFAKYKFDLNLYQIINALYEKINR